MVLERLVQSATGFPQIQEPAERKKGQERSPCFKRPFAPKRDAGSSKEVERSFPSEHRENGVVRNLEGLSVLKRSDCVSILITDVPSRRSTLPAAASVFTWSMFSGLGLLKSGFR